MRTINKYLALYIFFLTTSLIVLITQRNNIKGKIVFAWLACYTFVISIYGAILLLILQCKDTKGFEKDFPTPLFFLLAFFGTIVYSNYPTIDILGVYALCLILSTYVIVISRLHTLGFFAFADKVFSVQHNYESNPVTLNVGPQYQQEDNQV